MTVHKLGPNKVQRDDGPPRDPGIPRYPGGDLLLLQAVALLLLVISAATIVWLSK